MNPGQPQPALLFIPDISGFTQFVTETEILHSQHIVQELLEILIDSNDLGLQICEVEGDAVFFYRIGEKPALKSVLRQAEIMFSRFHSHLKLYQHQRICPCGACKSAVDLSLKIIVHFGEVTRIAVKDHRKLFGKDVILVHRLLKNNIDNREYLLLTDPVAGEMESTELPPWFAPRRATERYDLGDVGFCFSDLSELHKSVQVSLPVYNSSSGTYIAYTQEDLIPLPMEQIFQTLLDLQQRALSRQKGAAGESDSILKIGEKHPCLITKKDNVNVTESVKVETGQIEMIEMNKKGIAGYRYILKKLASEQTRLSVDMLIKDNPFFRIGFSLVVKWRMMKRIREFLLGLRHALNAPSS